MVIGNVVGSNLFNILAVLGIAGVIAPAQLDPAAASRDLYAMLAVTSLLVLVSYAVYKAKLLNRWLGLVFIACFVGYQVILFISETNT